MRYHILHRTGGVYSYFEGSKSEVEAHIERENKWDEHGTTTVQSSFEDKGECSMEFFRLIDANYPEDKAVKVPFYQ